MSLQTALSGLLGAQTGLNTVSNDLANADSTAFKSQTALFEDLYPEDSRNVPGIGTTTEAISSDLTQGNLLATGNPLDAAIQGNGYFLVDAQGTTQYTRDGAFQLSSNGELQTVNGATLMGYTPTSSGTQGAALGPITINTGAITAKPSSQMGVTLNLNSGDAEIPATTTFSETNPSTYSETTSVVVYDSMGNANRLQLYLVQNQPGLATETPTWTVYAQPQLSTGADVGGAQALTTLGFSNTGELTSGGSPTLAINWGNGSATSELNFNFTGTTLAAQTFAVAGLTNDGYPPGSYSGTSIDSSGNVVSTYSNGNKVTAGTLALANFLNPEGLTTESDNLYAATTTSGQPVINTPGNALAGTLTGGYLEASNASTSSLLVSLIQYQQAYQANTSVIQTEQQDITRLTQI
jgi:flagellar hook protein FlgE